MKPRNEKIHSIIMNIIGVKSILLICLVLINAKNTEELFIALLSFSIPFIPIIDHMIMKLRGEYELRQMEKEIADNIKKRNK